MIAMIISKTTAVVCRGRTVAVTARFHHDPQEPRSAWGPKKLNTASFAAVHMRNVLHFKFDADPCGFEGSAAVLAGAYQVSRCALIVVLLLHEDKQRSV